MFSVAGVYEPCGIFTKGHFILILLTTITILIALKFSLKNNKNINKIIKNITIVTFTLEIFRIFYNIKLYSFSAVNTYMPLYYCSIFLYAGLLSSFGNGIFKKTGNVCLATGSIIGGIIFIIYPSTTLPTYPAFHILSIHSFLYHGAMVYLGILINKTNYITLKLSDVKYFAFLIGIMGIIALFINNIFGGNLMFISENFPVFPINLIYNFTNGNILFSLIMLISQMTLPFYVVYGTITLYKKRRK